MGESKDSWWRKESFSVTSNNYCFKDSNKPAHWVGHSKLRSVDIDEFFKRTLKFDEKQASVTGNIEEGKNTAKNTNDDADEKSEANEINGKNK